MPSVDVATTSSQPLQLAYETFGQPDDRPLVLIAGFGVQLLWWERGWCERLAAGGRYVIRFDNRDIGLSTIVSGDVDARAVLGASLRGEQLPPVPYTLSDLAADVVGLLDALGIAAADIVGASMGGMIAQTVAIEHPDRVTALVSIMSSPGDPLVGKPTPEALEVLLTPPASEREALLDQAERTIVWASRRYGDRATIRRRFAAEYDRSFVPESGPRQLAAVYASGDRAAGLAALDVPALVIHGRDDTLISIDGGEATAAAIPGAHFLLVGDMGHDLPEPLWPLLTGAIVALGDA